MDAREKFLKAQAHGRVVAAKAKLRKEALEAMRTWWMEMRPAGMVGLCPASKKLLKVAEKLFGKEKNAP